MRRKLIFGALALAACAPTPAVDPNAAYRQVIWKSATPVATRAADLEACELAAIGAAPGQSQQQIISAAERVTSLQRRAGLEACLQSRGYQIVSLRICTPTDRASGPLRPILTVDNLPPADRVLCYAPEVDGFIPT